MIVLKVPTGHTNTVLRLINIVKKKRFWGLLTLFVMKKLLFSQKLGMEHGRCLQKMKSPSWRMVVPGIFPVLQGIMANLKVCKIYHIDVLCTLQCPIYF